MTKNLYRNTLRYRLMHHGKVVGVGYSVSPAHRADRVADAHGEDYICEWLFPNVFLSDAKEWEQEELQKLRAQGIDPIPQLKPLPAQNAAGAPLSP